MFLTGRKLGRIDLTPPGGTSYAKEQSNTNVMQYYSLQILHLKKLSLEMKLPSYSRVE